MLFLTREQKHTFEPVSSIILVCTTNRGGNVLFAGLISASTVALLTALVRSLRILRFRRSNPTLNSKPSNRTETTFNPEPRKKPQNQKL